MVHTQTIYPGAPGSGDVASQAEEVLRRLEAVLAEHSSDLAGVVRCDVMLASAEDFHEFNLVWRRFFPQDPPARWAVAVGDTHPAPGARVALHAVAVPADAEHSREILTSDDVPDTLAHEHCAQAVKVGDYVFPSAVAGIADYERGIVPDPSPLLPAAADQFQILMDRNQRLLQQAGTSLANTIKTQNIMTNVKHPNDPIAGIMDPMASNDWLHINPLWGQYMEAPPPPRTSVSVADLIVPGARTLPNITVLVPGADNKVEEIREGVRFVPIDHGWQFSAAVQTAEYISLAGHISIDYATFETFTINHTMPHLGSDIEIQADYVLEDRLAILEANGLGADSVVEAKVFLAAPRRDLRGLWRAWQRWFGDGPGPALQIVPVTGIHFQGAVVEIELLADRNA
jgi:enamine deaminase RidA (YjgF/YER057c/UK114 family)